MNKVEQDAVAMANQVDQNAPILQVAEAAVSTVLNPGPASIVADLELAVTLVQEFKAKLAGMHPSVLNLVKALF
jgi:hypothetical protein